MSPKKKKKLIISLIKDDLINSKLVNGLDAMGLESQDYFLHLSGTIFDLIGFSDCETSDEVYHEYVLRSKKVTEIDIKHDNRPLDSLASELYQYLRDAYSLKN
jgi:hypothetical protein